MDTHLKRLPRIVNNVISYFDFYNRKFIEQEKNSPLASQIIEDKNKIKADLIDLLDRIKENDKLTEFKDKSPDIDYWNLYLEEYRKEFRKEPRFKELNSIAVESYVYRSINSIFKTSNQTNFYQFFDPFYSQKLDSLDRVTKASQLIFSSVLNLRNRMRNDDFDLFDEFEKFLKFSLWANSTSDLVRLSKKKARNLKT